jgi:lysophospholipase L1-like esterase
LLAAYVQTEPNFALCDTWSVFADAQGNQIPEDFRTDRLHLNPTGYSVWKKALDPVMAKMQFGATAAQ